MTTAQRNRLRRNMEGLSVDAADFRDKAQRPGIADAERERLLRCARSAEGEAAEISDRLDADADDGVEPWDAFDSDAVGCAHSDADSGL